MEEVKFLEEKAGHKSFMRLNIVWYFWGICLPGSLGLLYVLAESILSNSLTVSDGGTLAGFFIVLQLGWIAPKQLSKMTEVSSMFKEMKDAKS